jgi:spore germination protein PE
LLRRFSIVNSIDIRTMGEASVFQIGDSHQIHTRSRSIAVQREFPIYDIHEGNFSSYALFYDTEISILKREYDVHMHTVQESPFICVASISLENTGNTGILHIGSTDDVFSNSRILQIRHFIMEEPFSEPSI